MSDGGVIALIRGRSGWAGEEFNPITDIGVEVKVAMLQHVLPDQSARLCRLNVWRAQGDWAEAMEILTGERVELEEHFLFALPEDRA